MTKNDFLQNICSEDDQKIELALQQLENNPELTDFANICFLNLIRARLNDPSATINDFPKVGFSKNDCMAFYMDNYDSEWFDFSQTPDETLRFVADFYGSITANFFNKESYLKAISNVHDQNDLYRLDLDTGSVMKKGFLDIRKHCSTSRSEMTWFDRMILAMYEAGLYGLKFDSCDLSAMNKSPFIDEFYFYILAQAYDSVEIHNYSSGPCYFPQLLWGAKAGIRMHDFKDVIIKIPENPLQVYNSWTLSYETLDGTKEEHQFADASWKKYFELKEEGTKQYKDDKVATAYETFLEAAKLQDTKKINQFILQCRRRLRFDLVPSYKKLIEMDPSDIQYINSLAFLYYGKNMFEEGLELINEATHKKNENNPDFGLAWATKAEIHFMLEQEDLMFKALKTCKKHGFDPKKCDRAIRKRYKDDSRYKKIVGKKKK